MLVRRSRHPPFPVSVPFNHSSMTQTESNMSRFKKWFMGAAVILLLFTVIGFFVVPSYVKSFLLDTL